MPRRDRTGPEGLGPRTGRGLGVCDIKKILSDEDDDIADKIVKKII